MRDFILFTTSATIQVLFCFIILYASKSDKNIEKQKLRSRFYLVAMTFALWCLIQYAYSISDNLRYQAVVVKIALVCTTWVGVFFWVFTKQLVNVKQSYLKNFAYIMLAISATFVGLFLEVVNLAIVDKNVEYTYNALLYSFVTVVPIIFIVRGVYSLEHNYKINKVQNPQVAKQSKYVSRGMIGTSALVFLGNFIFSFAGIGNSIAANLSVAVAPLIYTVSVGYAVFSLKLFNFRKFFSQVILYAIIFVLLYILVSLLLPIFYIEHTIGANFTDIAIALMLGIVIYPIISFTSKKVYMLTGNIKEIKEKESDLQLQHAMREVDIKTLATTTAIIIKNRYDLNNVIIGIALDDNNNQNFTIFPKEFTGELKNIELLSDTINVKDVGQVISTDELIKLNISQYSNGFPIKRGNLKGILLIGEKQNGRPIYEDEIIDVTKINNELSLALENSMQYFQIKEYNEDLQKKIDGATKELKKSNEKLKALDEAKDEFISMASHQLRTPLTSVKGYLSMLAEGDAGKLNDTQNKFIDQAFVSSQRMVYLIADLLNVSRLKTGKFIIEPKPVYLPDVIESEISQLYETVKARGIKMTFNKPKTFPIVNLDEVKLRQVIMNFTDNAIYYTPATGSIVLELKNVGDSVEFTVTDTGMGVPKNEQQHLFTKFYRAGNARKARPDGTGLGLFMAKKVIVASGGSLIFNSIEGKGSTFGFKFNTPTK